MFKKLSTSIVVAVALSSCFLSAANAAEANKKAGPPPPPPCPGSFIDGKPRKVQLMGKSIGSKVQEAFTLYSEDNLQGAIDILVDTSPSKSFDIATRARYLSVFYVQRGKGDDYKTAMKYLQEVVDLNVLTANEHSESLKLLADLQMQEQQYEKAIKNYYAWNKFTCKSNGDVWVRIANAHYELKQLAKVVTPANNAIKAFEKKPKQDPYVLKLRSFYDRKMYKPAIEVVEELVQLFPDKRIWWLQLANLYMLIENQDKSLQTLELAHKLGYLKSEAEHKMLSQLYMANQMPYKSAMVMKKYINDGVIKRDAKNLEAMGNALHAAMHIDDAADTYGEVAKLTNEAKHYEKSGILYVQDEQFKKGIVALTKAIDLGAKNPGRLYMSVAESHFYLGQYKKAHKAIKKAMTYPKVRKAAKSWESFIKDTAARKGVSV